MNHNFANKYSLLKKWWWWWWWWWPWSWIPTRRRPWRPRPPPSGDAAQAHLSQALTIIIPTYQQTSTLNNKQPFATLNNRKTKQATPAQFNKSLSEPIDLASVTCSYFIRHKAIAWIPMLGFFGMHVCQLIIWNSLGYDDNYGFSKE